MASLLVLWDVDGTLSDTGSIGSHLYQVAFTEMFGGQLPRPGSMAGRTDRAIVLEVLTLAGIPDPRGQVHAFEALLAAHAPELADLVRASGSALPGAARAMAALATLPGAAGNGDASGAAGRGGSADTDGAAGPHGNIRLVQSLLTGNIRPLAEVKLGTLGLTDHLDLAVGAYGDASEIRADLVHLARGNAALAYGRDFGGQATVLVGDTPRDVEAALLTGARAVGVATGSFSVARLAAAGAHAVLPDLADTDRVVAAILGTHAP